MTAATRARRCQVPNCVGCQLDRAEKARHRARRAPLVGPFITIGALFLAAFLLVALAGFGAVTLLGLVAR